VGAEGQGQWWCIQQYWHLTANDGVLWVEKEHRQSQNQGRGTKGRGGKFVAAEAVRRAGGSSGGAGVLIGDGMIGSLIGAMNKSDQNGHDGLWGEHGGG